MSFTKQLVRDERLDTVRQRDMLFFLILLYFQSDHPFIHFLTLIEKFDVFLVCCSEALFLLVVCGASRSRVMVLLTIRTVENNLGCREADGCKKKNSMSQADEVLFHFQCRKFLKVSASRLKLK